MALSSEIIEQMETAALLPDDDPQRQEVLAAIGLHGPEARQYWLDLLRADERLRLDLFAAAMPEDLNKKLLAIPDAPHAVAGKIGISASRRALSRAALLMLVAGLAYFLYPKISGYRFNQWQDAQLKEMAAWAVENHVTPPANGVESGDPAVIRKAFGGGPMHMAIATPIFPAADGARLLGGGATTLHDKPVVYTRYVMGDVHYTLFEFMPSEFGLAPDFRGRTEMAQQTGAANKQYAVEMWSQDYIQCGWLLVKDSPQAPSPYKPIY